MVVDQRRRLKRRDDPRSACAGYGRRRGLSGFVSWPVWRRRHGSYNRGLRRPTETGTPGPPVGCGRRPIPNAKPGEILEPCDAPRRNRARTCV